MNPIILVNDQDEVIGSSDKQTVHEEGLCHRAFSVFVIRKRKKEWETLLQQRHPLKHHCGNLWTNSCCSHPYPGETTIAGGERRLQEELGFSCKLTEIGVFHYIAHFSNGLIENEVDHVLIGYYDEETIPYNPLEVKQVQWQPSSAILADYNANPTNYTPWFMQAFKLVNDHFS